MQARATWRQLLATYQRQQQQQQLLLQVVDAAAGAYLQLQHTAAVLRQVYTYQVHIVVNKSHTGTANAGHSTRFAPKVQQARSGRSGSPHAARRCSPRCSTEATLDADNSDLACDEIDCTDRIPSKSKTLHHDMLILLSTQDT
jgi:hypothetical protein